MMWMHGYMEGGEFSWVDVLWHVEGLLKWDFSTPISITSLEEEEPPIVVLAYPMVENHTSYKGYSNMN